MNRSGHVRHLRTRQPAAARAAGRSSCFELPELQFPRAAELRRRAARPLRRRRAAASATRASGRRRALDLRRAAGAGQPHRPRAGATTWAWCRGNRVLLRGANSPMLAACWFGVVKAGGIAVGTHAAAARQGAGQPIVDKAQVTPRAVRRRAGRRAARWRGRLPDADAGAALQRRRAATAWKRAQRAKPPTFDNVDTAADDTCLDRLHVRHHRHAQGHDALPPRRDGRLRMLAAARAARARADDVLHRQPAAGLHLRPGRPAAVPDVDRRVDACCSRRPRPTQLLAAIAQYRATVLLHRADLVPRDGGAGVQRGATCRSLRKCVSAGEALPAATRALWKQATGIEMIDGIGSTEMLHIFISADEAHARGRRHRQAGARLSRPACSTTTARRCRAARSARLAVKGPTGCRYLADERQASYVQDGWNLTGDAYLRRRRRLLRLPGAHRRHDHLGRLQHRRARGRGRAAAAPGGGRMRRRSAWPTTQRGQIVKAFVVLRAGHGADDALAKTLQDFVKQTHRALQVPARDRVLAPACRAPRPASCSAFGCGSRRPERPARDRPRRAPATPARRWSRAGHPARHDGAGDRCAVRLNASSSVCQPISRFVARATADTQFVHSVRATARAARTRVVDVARAAAGRTAVVWVSWPKKSPGVASDVDRERACRRIALPMGWVDVKVCARRRHLVRAEAGGAQSLALTLGAKLSGRVNSRAAAGGAARRADLVGGLRVVVGHAVVGDAVLRVVEHRVGRCRVAVARLARRARNDQPPAIVAQHDRRARPGHVFAGASGFAGMEQAAAHAGGRRTCSGTPVASMLAQREVGVSGTPTGSGAYALACTQSWIVAPLAHRQRAGTQAAIRRAGRCVTRSRARFDAHHRVGAEHGAPSRGCPARPRRLARRAQRTRSITHAGSAP